MGQGLLDQPRIPCTSTPIGIDLGELELFHPKNAGTTGYAQVIGQALTDIGYKGS